VSSGTRLTASWARRIRILTAVGLEPDVDRRYPHEFSGGQLRRVVLARIPLPQPRLLILDELTCGLDMSVQATVLNLLRDIQRMFGLSVRTTGASLYAVSLLAPAPRLGRTLDARKGARQGPDGTSLRGFEQLLRNDADPTGSINVILTLSVYVSAPQGPTEPRCEVSVGRPAKCSVSKQLARGATRAAGETTKVSRCLHSSARYWPLPTIGVG
jgi:ABC transporter